MEKSKIKFQPLHDGMGFHPFSDGLPYAPESKAKYQNGAGANVAGRPQFATSASALTVQPKAAIKTARQLQEQKPSLDALTQMTAQRLAQQVISSRPMPQAQAAKQQQAQVAPTVQFTTTTDTGLLRRRAFAYLMDTVIHAGFWLLTNLTALFLFKFQFDSDILKDNSTAFILFFIASQWMFVALQEVLFENSIGKVFFNLEFKHHHKSLFIRSLVFMCGALAFGTGFLYRPQDKFGVIQLKKK